LRRRIADSTCFCADRPYLAIDDLLVHIQGWVNVLGRDGFARPVGFKTRYLVEGKVGKRYLGKIPGGGPMEEKGKTTTQIRCPLCGVEFPSQEELDLHKKDVHPGQ
jgi:hypothetical protein